MHIPSPHMPLAGVSNARLPAWALPADWPTQHNGTPLSADLTFADGQERAQASGSGSAYVDKAEASLPPEIRDRITRRRKAGEEDAAIDPLAQPEVKAAIARATFEVLVGFQLTQDQLTYNATR